MWWHMASVESKQLNGMPSTCSNALRSLGVQMIEALGHL